VHWRLAQDLRPGCLEFFSGIPALIGRLEQFESHVGSGADVCWGNARAKLFQNGAKQCGCLGVEHASPLQSAYHNAEPALACLLMLSVWKDF